MMRIPRSSSRLRYSMPAGRTGNTFPLLLITALVSLGIGLAAGVAYVKLQAPSTAAVSDSASAGTAGPLSEPTSSENESGGGSACPPVTAADTAPQDPAAPPATTSLKRTIASGDTASSILSCYLSPSQIHELGQTAKKVFPLTRLRVGNSYVLNIEGDRLLSMEYEVDQNEKLAIACTDNGFDVSLEPIVYDVQTSFVAGTITSNLFNAVEAAGETAGFGITLADIFAWDVDFVRDIREGDSFRAIVEKRYRDGKPAGYGRIQAAEFINQGHRYTAFLFRKKDEREAYYDADGKSMRKAFLKAPLHFSRISSGYSMSRLHPILKKRRPHQGIDYAAPTGTPIMTVADGTIVARSRTGAAGNYLKIRHRNGYETVYNHMSRYAKGMNKGKKVTQGQVIGYVGSTGYATGPHLDFRMKRNGNYLNPLTVKSPSGAPVPGEELQAFKAKIAPLVAALEKNDQPGEPAANGIALAKADVSSSKNGIQ